MSGESEGGSSSSSASNCGPSPRVGTLGGDPYFVGRGPALEVSESFVKKVHSRRRYSEHVASFTTTGVKPGWCF